jgi:hypothetical protein
VKSVSCFILNLPEYMILFDLKVHCRHATGWMVWGSNPGRGEIFHTCPDGPGAHPASCTMGAGSFLGVKWPGRGASHPTPPSTKANERVELYLYSPLGLMVCVGSPL